MKQQNCLLHLKIPYKVASPYIWRLYQFLMTLNLRKQATQKTNPTQMRTEFMQKHKITVNQPSQTHFSVEGVQAYSPEQIAAMKVREERVNAASQKDGEYVKVQAYKIDDEIQFGDRPPTANESMGQTLKPKKNKKADLQEAKPEKKQVKPSIRNQMGRANQTLVKRNKNLEKKDLFEKRLQELKEQYKKDFGDELKPKNRTKKQTVKKEAEQEQINKDNEDFQMEEGDGDQCLPANVKPKQKSIKTMTKTLKEDHDDSFEDVQWEDNKTVSVRSSRLNPSTYSEKLGNAVHLLFD